MACTIVWRPDNDETLRIIVTDSNAAVVAGEVSMKLLPLKHGDAAITGSHLVRQNLGPSPERLSGDRVHWVPAFSRCSPVPLVIAL